MYYIYEETIYFFIGKELYESILILAKWWIMLYAIPLFSLIWELVLSEIALYFSEENITKLLIPSFILINLNILSNQIGNSFTLIFRSIKCP